MNQLSLFDNRQAEIERAFNEYHRANPAVWQAFERFAFEAIRAGMKKYSARAIIHRIRWFVEVETKSSDGFSVNNNLSPYYARMFMARYSQHQGFFETRELISARG